ncbi:MAG: DUF4405 domain-containing protein [Deltaproteobacteria bacterium]|nr:DUF4405 domain-containing protein [Deltaproteobacteria bacterium]MBW1952601.1 DUF4405 domain-containing protein [Deltaproteobacteria bacterium]MBW1986273.1 DUF4405 domain-containing protein [Deltaproteobacteria bacterium]MBW2135595.1 DUF4405 domain-containing protein [Deltaproteobacteria bacterium]
MWNKAKVNFVIDALMFMCMCAIAGIGFLIKYVLIPGEERWAVYGRNVDLLWFGMNRHEWGSIHLYLALSLLILLVIHIILHWQMILSLFKNLIGQGKTRSVITVVFVGICLVLISFSFFVTPEVEELRRGRGRRFDAGQVILPERQPFPLVSKKFVR